MSRKISIIVTCYNLEKEIGQCLDSLIGQTYENLEVIVIDDGSKDNSVAVLKEYSQKDARIQYVSQKNQGPSAARNVGIKKVTGDYIMFIDGDDYIGRTYIEELEGAIVNDCDMVIAGLRYVYSNGEENCVDGIRFHDNIENFLDKYYATFVEKRLVFGPVNKLYKRELLNDNNIFFDTTIEIREDGLFVLEALEKVKYLSGIENSEYYYIQHSLNGSLVTKYHKREPEINLRFFKKILSMYNGRELTAEEISKIYPIYLNMDISSIRKFFNSENPSFKQGLDYINKILKNNEFRVARKELRDANSSLAGKYYRPAILVYIINILAVKRLKRK